MARKDNQVAKKTLNENVLNIIGQLPKEVRKFALPVHSTFTVRWVKNLQLGLPKEERLELIKKYAIRGNWSFFVPPK